MEKCNIPWCRNYMGKDCGKVCSFHRNKFEISAIISFEKNKIKGIGVPVHDKRTPNLIYLKGR